MLKGKAAAKTLQRAANTTSSIDVQMKVPEGGGLENMPREGAPTHVLR